MTLLILSLLAFWACQDAVLPYHTPEIVVEGWIENEGYPVVMLTTTVPVNESVKDSSDLAGHIIRWGKVTVSDGEKEVVLAGKKDDRYFPPYIYTTSRIKGEVGKTYRLMVEYSGRIVTASTTIPKPAQLEYIKVRKTEDEKYYMSAGLKDDRSTKDYYKIFTKVRKRDSTYNSAFLGLTDDVVLGDGIEEIPINKGVGSLTGIEENHFSLNDIVDIRFCTLDRKSWEYWSDFEEIQSLSRNPFFPITTDIRSNIEGGLGYWAGYGSTYYSIEISSP
jgi:hypothetical protein